MIRSRSCATIVLAALVAACQPAGSDAGDAPGVLPDAGETEAYDGIPPDETLRFVGTEPFWGGDVTGGELTYSTIDDQDGTKIAVERFAGRGGLSYNGRLGEQDFAMTVTPLSCSDGMSDRTYPFTVTVVIGQETRNGCGWSESEPFEGPDAP